MLFDGVIEAVVKFNYKREILRSGCTEDVVSAIPAGTGVRERSNCCQHHLQRGGGHRTIQIEDRYVIFQT